MTVFNRYFYGDTAGGDLKKRAITASLTVATVLIVAKALAYVMTDSISLLSSLMDSCFDLITSALAFVSITHAAHPADHDHRFGHGKIEALGALAQGLMILGTAVFLFIEGLKRIAVPQAVERPLIGVAVMALSIVLTFALISYQKRVIAHTKSIAVTVDNLHYTGDLWMNVAVLAALGLGYLTGWAFIDPLFTIGIAIWLLAGAVAVGKHTFDILLDRELPEEDRRKILSLVASHTEVRGVHDLRTRNTGERVFIEFHMEVDGSLAMSRVHDMMDEVEEMLFKAYPKSEVLIHPEPAGLHDFRLDHAIKG